MTFTFRLTAPDDDDAILELNLEAIDYLIEGLEELRDKEPGDELTTPSLAMDGVGSLVLRRAADEDS